MFGRPAGWLHEWIDGRVDGWNSRYREKNALASPARLGHWAKPKPNTSPTPSKPKIHEASTSNATAQPTQPQNTPGQSRLYNPFHHPAIRQHPHFSCCSPPPRRGIGWEQVVRGEAEKEEREGFLGGFFPPLFTRADSRPTPGITGCKHFTFSLPAAQIHNPNLLRKERTPEVPKPQSPRSSLLLSHLLPSSPLVLLVLLSQFQSLPGHSCAFSHTGFRLRATA